MSDGPNLPNASGFTLRDATEKDLDDITRVHVEGFTEEPQVLYCYPWRHKYPEDHWNWTKREYAEYLQQPSKYVVHVIKASVPDQASGLGVTKPFGIAVWNIAVLTKSMAADPGLDQRRDIDKRRLEAFLEKAGQRFKTYFWGEEQVNLSTLVVHPDFRRRGGGTMLITWGIKRAESKGWPATLCASPMGRFLYEHLGFQTIATEVVQVEGEEETLESTVMVLPPKEGL
ncbi:acyl-CoA N-acyltransferase [Rhypophila decipiens]|uniref:Acyl-CoA N-acyltransferase n=1 Tax=Rhypophila decipiens TaxID=261697 RepID=A0AAN6XV79_9PEZI|nr:acyl-CoA N-acyltransferase [Rhypophila decipiens]